jgi:transposase
MAYLEQETQMLNFRDYNQQQGVFRQLVPNELLEDDHPARIVDAVVERLDLTKVYAFYKEEGNTAYHPKMMLKVLFYSYLIGLMSSRKMEAGLTYRADYIFLSGDQVPDFRTLNNFRVRHIEQLPGLFSQIVLLCAALGMIDFKHLAIDGQKIAASANFRNNVDKRRAEKQIKKIEKGMNRLLSQEPTEPVNSEVIEERKKRLERKQAKLERALLFLETCGNETASVNMVDSDAKMMTHKDRKIVPSYNHQSAVDGAYGITCAVATTQTGDQPGDLFGLVDAATENAGDNFKNVLADSGFSDYERLEKMETERSETHHVPDRRNDVTESGETARGEYDKSRFVMNENGTMICPQGEAMREQTTSQYDDGHTVTIFIGTGCSSCPVCSQCTKAKDGIRRMTYDSREPYRDIMRDRLQSEKGRENYRKRQGIVEPAHGNDQKNLGFKQHYLRGKKKASVEFLLIRLAQNIGKIARYKAAEMREYFTARVSVNVCEMSF